MLTKNDTSLKLTSRWHQLQFQPTLGVIHADLKTSPWGYRDILRWVTISGFNSWCRTFISVCNQPPRSTQPGHPFVGRRNDYQPKAVTTCGLGVKADMVRVWVAGKTVWSYCYTQTISECFRDKGLIYKALHTVYS